LGSDQVLVLVNGKRRHQSALVNVNGTINRGQVGTDLSALPPSSIDRVEVLRDGAAAQYGSDAIAGVVNVILKKSTGILSGNISYGSNITSYEKDYALHRTTNSGNSKTNITDGGVMQIGLNYGITIGKKGFLNMSGEYTLRDASNRTGTYTGQIYPSIGGVNSDVSIMAARSTNRNTFDMRIGNSKIAGGAFFINSEYELGKNWSFTLFGGFSKKKGESAGFYRYPTSIASSGGTYTNSILNIYPDGFLPLIKSDIKDYSLSAGISGKLGSWDASLSNTFGLNQFDYTVDNSINYTQLAITSNPQHKFDAGGISFLQNTANLDLSRKLDVLKGLNLAFGAEFRIDQYGQRAGEEASYKNYDLASKAASGAQVFAGFLPANDGKHSRTSQALYADAELDITAKWLLEAALRFENYSDFGSTLNYKLSSRYKLANWLTVRGSATSGFRAPSMQQRFYSKTNTLFITQPGGAQVPVEAGTFTNDSKPAQILGIPELKQETSQSFSAGFALKPAKGLEITIDGYYVKINDRIILTNNFTGGTNADLTAQLNAAGASTANFFTNAVNTSAKGLEAVVAYSKAFGKHQFKFTFASNFISNQVEKNADGSPVIKASATLTASGQVGNYFNREDQSRFEVAAPKNKLSFMVNYRYAKFAAMLRATSFGSVTYLDGAKGFSQNIVKNDFTGNLEATDQTFTAKTVTDLSLSYDALKQVTFTIGANNLFDVYQDLQAHSANVSLGRFNYSRRVNQMGVNGRYLFARVSFSLGKR
jgi:iron complex outermembrane receptor protein